MKVTLWITRAALVGALAVGGWSVQAADDNTSRGRAAMSDRLGSVEEASQLIGKQVRHQNETIGTIQDFVVDLESGRILFAAVKVGGDTVAVAPGVLRMPGRADRVMASVDKSEFSGAPKIDLSNKERLASHQFAYQVHQHFGEDIWWRGANDPAAGSKPFNNVHRVTELKGKSVQNTSGEPVGKVNTALLDLQAGRIAFVVLNASEMLGGGKDSRHALPPNMFTVAPDQQGLIADVTKEKLSSAPKLASYDRVSSSLGKQIYSHYGKEPYFSSEPRLTPTGRDDNNLDRRSPRDRDEFEEWKRQRDRERERSRDKYDDADEQNSKARREWEEFQEWKRNQSRNGN